MYTKSTVEESLTALWAREVLIGRVKDRASDELTGKGAMLVIVVFFLFVDRIEGDSRFPFLQVEGFILSCNMMLTIDPLY